MRRGTGYLALVLIAILSSRAATAGPALLFEASNGKVLFAEGADTPWYPASLTKMMTAYLTFEAIKSGRLTLNSTIKCSAAAHNEPPSKIGLPIGGELTVEKALQALIVKSANDVAVMLAEAVAGSEANFIVMMNATAQRLGMTQTKFTNPNGLPSPEQVSTARDLAKLSRAIITDFPEYSHFWSLSQMKLGKIRLSSHNGLLKSLEGADGLKTGFTCDSGFNIVASATRDGRQLVVVVLGDATSAERNVRAASLLEHGFQQFGWKQIFNNKTVDNLPYEPTVTTVKSVRESVTSWGCNKKQRTSNAKKRTKKNRAKKQPEALKLDSAQATAVANPPSLELKGPINPSVQAQ
jgi:D-alanyl-D-alanine carboxypeptidase